MGIPHDRTLFLGQGGGVQFPVPGDENNAPPPPQNQGTVQFVLGFPNPLLEFWALLCRLLIEEKPGQRLRRGRQGPGFGRFSTC